MSFRYIPDWIYSPHGTVTPSEELDGGRFWSLEEIRSNLGKEIFTPNFENEFRKLNF